MCPQEVPNGRSKFPENNNSNGDITKDTEPVAELGESEHVGKSGTVTKIVPPVVEKASSQYTDSKRNAISPNGDTKNVSKAILKAINTLDNSIERELYMATISNEEWRLTYGHHLMEKNVPAHVLKIAVAVKMIPH